LLSFLQRHYETLEKCSISFEFKEGENFNRRNTLSILRIALKVSADASLRVTKVPKFLPDAEIGRKGAFCKGISSQADDLYIFVDIIQHHK